MKRPSKRTVRYAYPQSRTNRLLRSKPTSADVLNVAGAAFETEKWLHAGVRVTELTIPLFDCDAYNRKHLENTLSDILLYVLAETVRVLFTPLADKPKPLRKKVDLLPVANICLFSGGTDSWSGILCAKRDLGDVEGVFCAHSDQSRIVTIVTALQRDVFRQIDLTLRKVSVPAVGIHGYAQLRGFLYCVAAAAWMALLQSRTLIVTECGPTMYQPLFSPLDSVTMTTHPVVLRHARAAMEILLRRPIALVTPFEDFTKAEVIALCPRSDMIRHTHSCISQRFGSHDGTCYGCVIRRLAAIAAGVTDVQYTHDPISDESASGGNLMSLLTYCHDLLVAYDRMEAFEVHKIKLYSKRNLFERFALDQFAALHVLRDMKRPMRAGIGRMLDSVIATLGRDVLDARLHQLRQFNSPIDWRRLPPQN